MAKNKNANLELNRLFWRKFRQYKKSEFEGVPERPKIDIVVLLPMHVFLRPYVLITLS